MPTTRWNPIHLCTGGLALAAALASLTACQEVLVIGEPPNDDGSDSSSTGEPDLSGTLYAFTHGADKLLGIDPSTGVSTVITTFSNAGDYIENGVIVIDPVQNELTVYRYDLDTLSGTFTIVDPLTGAVTSEASTLVHWVGLGRVEATGEFVGVAYGIPNGVVPPGSTSSQPLGGGQLDFYSEVFSVASVDPTTGESTVIATQLDSRVTPSITFDGVNTFVGTFDDAFFEFPNIVGAGDATPAGGYQTIDATTAEQVRHRPPHGFFDGTLLEPGDHRLLGTSDTWTQNGVTPTFAVETIDVDTDTIASRVELPADLQWVVTGAVDFASNRYFMLGGGDPSEVLTVDVDTGELARRPISGTTPGGGIVFSPGSDVPQLSGTVVPGTVARGRR